MSDFVDYNKRSVTLPPGCKDLIDVLRPHGLDVTRGGKVEGRLSDIEKHVHRAITSTARSFTLVITPADGRLTFKLLRVSKEALRASIDVETKTPHEAAVRQFLANHHLQQPPDDLPGLGPFLQNLP
jgi:hypothetical protein